MLKIDYKRKGDKIMKTATLEQELIEEPLYTCKQEIEGLMVPMLIVDEQTKQHIEAQDIEITQIKSAEDIKTFCLVSLAYSLNQMSKLCKDGFVQCEQPEITKESLKLQFGCVHYYIERAISNLELYNDLTNNSEESKGGNNE